MKLLKSVSRQASTPITTIASTRDLFRFLDDCVQSNENVMYRGLRKQSHALIPSIGRFSQKKDVPFTSAREHLMLKLFRQKTFGLVEPNLNDLALLTVAQQHGMPTRLMDWTRHSLVAIFFAVRDEFRAGEKAEDSVVYYCHPKDKVSLGQDFDPFEIDRVRRFVPQYWSPRIVAQNGLFTVHPNPRKPFESPGLKRVLIKHDARKDIKLALN